MALRPRRGYILHTHGDAQSALTTFLKAWWAQTGLVALLAPVQSPDCGAVFPQVLTDPEQLITLNAFAPVMPVNSAGLIDELLAAHPHGKVGVLLRPCELRTWVEMCKRRDNCHPAAGSMNGQRLYLLAVDCPGTLDPVEFAHRASKDGIAALTAEALDWAAHARWINSHLRPACQRCEWPVPTSADLTICLLGLNSDEYLLVYPAEQDAAESQAFERLVDGLATEELWLRRSSATALVIERRTGALPNVRRVTDTNSLLAVFARCTMCTDCLDVCPLYEGELAGMLGVSGASAGAAPLLVNLVAVSRWLASCSGCGMCQEACSQDIPLLNIVLGINQRIRSELDYHPGDPAFKLPWT
jgi:formate dehydrogenase subunit beta